VSHNDVDAEFLLFEVAGARFGLPVASVREIARVPNITPVPRSPADVAGVMLASGVVITVIDLARRLRLPPTASTGRARILLIRQRRETLGLLVDDVIGVRQLVAPESALDPETLAAPGSTNSTGS
jgi:purine-binding chemotaxis protein CheW